MIHLPDLQSWNYYFAHVMKSCWRFVNAYKIVFTVFIYRLCLMKIRVPKTAHNTPVKSLYRVFFISHDL